MIAVKVLVVSSFPERFNANPDLLEYIRKGFATHLGEEAARTCGFTQAETEMPAFMPDLVLLVGSCFPDACNYQPFRRHCARHSAVLAFWQTDDPYEFDFNWKLLDVDRVFSNDAWAVTHYDHRHVSHLPLAADPETHFRPVVDTFARDLFFCGVAFANRVRWFRDCAGWMKTLRTEVLGTDWPKDLAFARNERVANAQLADWYATSCLTMNLGRELNLANALFNLTPSTPGPRTFEAAMAGSLQCYFVDGLEILDYFDEDDEILLFDSPDDLRNKVQRLIENPALRQQMATAAQQRALHDHTYAARAATILRQCLQLETEA